MLTNDEKCRREVQSGIVMATAAFSTNGPVTSKLDVNLREKLVKCYIWSVALCGAESWRVWKVDQKCLKRFEMWRWRSIVPIV
jgi:hypothetical protein